MDQGSRAGRLFDAGQTPAPGDVLADRYRLVEAIRQDGSTTLWRAVDDVLARTVSVRLLDALSAQQIAAFVTAARRAGAVNDRRLTAVYDADVVGSSAFVAAEWCEAPTLAELLAAGPLPPDEALRIVREVAGAVVHAHAAGIEHGALSPLSVHVAPSGAVKVADLAITASTSGAQTDQRRDTRALGQLLYAAVTGRWPGPGARSGGLPPAPFADAGLPAARSLSPGIPRSVDTFLTRVLTPEKVPALAPIVTAKEFVRELPTLPRGAVTHDEPVAGPAGLSGRRLQHVRRGIAVAVPLAMILGIGVVGYRMGVEVGEVPDVASRFPTLPRATAPAASGGPAAAGGPIRVAAVQSFDPLGDGAENAGAVDNVVDGDESTVWETERYDASPEFGGLKDGVGLLFDLGAPRAVRQVTVAFTEPGASVELRAAATPAAAIDGYKAVAGDDDAERATVLRPSPATTARYWVVWLTRLPEGERGFRGSVAEVMFAS